MSSWNDFNGFTKGPNGTETNSKIVEAIIAGLLLLTGYGLMKFLSNSKAKINEVDINRAKASNHIYINLPKET